MEDYVWAVSEGGLTAAHIDAPELELNAVTFSGVDPCWWWDPYGYDGYTYGYDY